MVEGDPLTNHEGRKFEKIKASLPGRSPGKGAEDSKSETPVLEQVKTWVTWRDLPGL